MDTNTIPLADSESRALAPLSADPSITLMQSAIEKGFSADDINKLIAMQERLQANEARAAFREALAAAQGELQPVRTNARNRQTESNYADLGAVALEVGRVFGRHGLALSFKSGDNPKPDHFRIHGELSHRAGHVEPYFLDVPMDGNGLQGKKNMTPIHAMGSTISYGRRYLTLMIANLAIQDDNDGNAQVGDSANASAEQIAELKSIIKKWQATGAVFSLGRFLNFCQEGLKNFDGLTTAGFEKGKAELNRWLAKKGGAK